ncbi:MAG: substrate-binding domain-containing protein [Victivallaceae bacterium]|nr:substrate-binding domain-containing protein [Victivallaceae bacterium]
MAELGTMSLSKGHTKSSMVAEAIAENIHSGVLKPGSRIQTVRALADKFSVSISVIQSAMRELEERKLIKRKTNSIALIRDTVPVHNAEKQIMLCLQSSGHIFSEVSTAISDGLISRGYLPVAMDFKKMDDLEPDEKFKKNIRTILDSGLKSIILTGHNYWHYPFLENHPDVRAVFLYLIDYAGKMPERAVLLDLESTIFQTTAHLASRGYKKIMLCTFKPEPHAINIETIHRHQSTQIRGGYKRALREYNIASYDKILYRDHEVNSQEIAEVLKSKNAPEAIVCDMDYTALQVVITAMKNGLKVPDDLAVTGAFNTPWSELSPIPLTTVTYDWNELANLAMKLALEDDPEQKITYIKPTLIIKTSTGGP